MYLQNEKCLLFDSFNSYVAFNPDKETLDYFFKVILRNPDYINLKEINEKKLHYKKNQMKLMHRIKKELMKLMF